MRKPTGAYFGFPLKISNRVEARGGAGVCLHVSLKSATAQKLTRLSVALEVRDKGARVLFASMRIFDPS